MEELIQFIIENFWPLLFIMILTIGEKEYISGMILTLLLAFFGFHHWLYIAYSILVIILGLMKISSKIKITPKSKIKEEDHTGDPDYQ